MPPGNSLFESDSVERWRACLTAYDTIIKAFSNKKVEAATKAKKPKPNPTLLQLDNWYQKELPAAVRARAQPHLTHAEITKLMQWKLTRGKFRPRLAQLVQENPAETVVSCTRDAFDQYSKDKGLPAAIKALSTLKAVGPATASAILCCRFPDTCPFMADESVGMTTGGARLQYTAAEYATYARRVMAKARQLTAKDKPRKWTAHDVEVAMWTSKMADTLGHDLDEHAEVDEDVSPSADASATEPKAKRSKK